MTFEIIFAAIFVLIIILIAYHLLEDNNCLTNKLHSEQYERTLEVSTLLDRIEQLRSVERMLQNRLDSSEKTVEFALEQNSKLTEENALLNKKLEIVYLTIKSLQENTDSNSTNEGSLS